MVKARVARLPWLKDQQESGAIEFTERTARDYMRIAGNRQHAADLERPSIRAALELLTEDKSDEAQSALGFESFEQYGEVKRGLSKSQLYRLADAAEVQLSLDSPMGEKIPERHLRPLAPLSDDERRQVWEEATADPLAAEYKVSPATRAYRHRHLPSDRAKDLGKPGSWSAATAPSCYRKAQVARLVRGGTRGAPPTMGDRGLRMDLGAERTLKGPSQHKSQEFVPNLLF